MITGFSGSQGVPARRMLEQMAENRGSYESFGYQHVTLLKNWQRILTRLAAETVEDLQVLRCLLHMPQIEFALDTAESTANVQDSGINLGHVQQTL